VSLTGSSFGHNDYTTSTRTGGSACQATTWVSDSSTLCKITPGMSMALSVSATSGASVGTLSVALSYDKPSVHVLATTNHPAKGLSSITMSGAEFGAMDTTVRSRIGDSACEASVWVSGTSVKCRVPRGVGRTLDVVVTGARQEGALTQAASYDAPTVASVALTNSPTGGKTSVTVTGADFGTFSGSVRGRVGGSACEATVWVSDSSVICKPPDGVGAGWPVSITVGTVVSTRMAAFSYNSPSLSSLTVGVKPTTGSAQVTLSGAGFGYTDPTGRARVGGSACEATLWISDSRIVCQNAQGVGSQKDVAVTVALQLGSLAQAFTFDSPTVTAVDPASTTPASGATIVSIFGSNFGKFSYSDRARLGRTACEATAWVSDSLVTCKAPAGLGLGLNVVTTVAGIRGTAVASVAYTAPQVTSVNGATVTTSPAVGGEILTILGSSFGVFDASVTVIIGSSSAKSASWVSDTSIVSNSPSGVQLSANNYDVTVNVAGRTHSKVQVFKYSTPIVLSLGTANGQQTAWDAYSVASATSYSRFAGPLTGGNVLTITGTHFGSSSYGLATQNAKIGTIQCTNALHWVSDTSMECLVPSIADPTNCKAGCRVSYDVSVTVATLQTAYATYKYDCVCKKTVSEYECFDAVESSGVWSCQDVDECTAASSARFYQQDCSAQATCANTVGSYTCSCNAGYTGTGQACTACDVGKFKTTVDNVACTTCVSVKGNSNTVGTGSTASSQCLCNVGYGWDGSSCTACAIGSYKASVADATCSTCSSYRANSSTSSTGSTSSASCLCQPGYTLNVAVCDPCAAGTYKDVLGDGACTP
jgi:hypothetical protein